MLKAPAFDEPLRVLPAARGIPRRVSAFAKQRIRCYPKRDVAAGGTKSHVSSVLVRDASSV